MQGYVRKRDSVLEAHALAAAFRLLSLMFWRHLGFLSLIFQGQAHYISGHSRQRV